jgi:hypothetical protein
VRLLDADTHIVVCANALKDNVRLYRVVRGDRQQLMPPSPGTLNKAHTATKPPSSMPSPPDMAKAGP